MASPSTPYWLLFLWLLWKPTIQPPENAECVRWALQSRGSPAPPSKKRENRVEIKMNTPFFPSNLCRPWISKSLSSSSLILSLNKWMKSCSCAIKYACLICFSVHISGGEGVVAVRGLNLLMRRRDLIHSCCVFWALFCWIIDFNVHPLHFLLRLPTCSHEKYGAPPTTHLL